MVNPCLETERENIRLKEQLAKEIQRAEHAIEWATALEKRYQELCEERRKFLGYED